MWWQAQVWSRIRIPQKGLPPSRLRLRLLPSSASLSPSLLLRTLSTTRTTADMGAAGQHTVNTTERLTKLRELMQKQDIDVQAVVIPSEDQHSSEYLAHCDERRAFISGFNGSAGCAIVTLDKAYLFTDGRYFLQAEKQLDQNWTLMKQGLPGSDVPTWQEFLHKNLEGKTKIGIDATLISASDAESLNKQLAPKESSLVSLSNNLVDEIWTDRPARPANPVFHLDEKYSGQSHLEKVEKIREELVKKKAKAVVVTMLDEVAWLFNLRGSDIDFNPVFFAYAVVTTEKVTLFINEKQLDDTARGYLEKHVEIKPYDSFFDHLKGLPSTLDLKDDTTILLGDKASLAVAEALGKNTYTIVRSPVTDLKAIKNATELEGFRQSHIRDGAALARYFAWLEEQLNNGAEINESQGSDQLEKYRSELDLFKGLSFTTISSTGPNGAIIHYSPDPNDCDIIKKDQIYLCDSGGQYLDGTTDVTRTWHFGTPTDEEKRAFTRVLQGHIAIDTAVFPNGTTGYIIDAFARRALWQDGLDFRHGTGHGVGHFLNVHEGPQGIGTRITLNNAPLKPGMTVSNEPGYYADGRFGIRIENVVLVTEAKTPNNFGDKGYLGFENVTMCPIQVKLIDTSLLTPQEKAWVNAYHEEVFSKVSPLLQNDQRALQWLTRECKNPI
uniref:Xaa-Pro aminopeptidase P n=1 Tax=Psilocybe cubensis TaxID=181762 RepID=A0A8H7XM06_PSICU